MLKLRDTFQKADTDGGGDLDIDEFVDAFDGRFCVSVSISCIGSAWTSEPTSLCIPGVLPAGSQEELRKLFLRIDANSDGTVDWDEFATFILLENQGAANLRESETVLQFHPTQMPDKVGTKRNAHAGIGLCFAHCTASQGP